MMILRAYLWLGILVWFFHAPLGLYADYSDIRLAALDISAAIICVGLLIDAAIRRREARR